MVNQTPVFHSVRDWFRTVAQRRSFALWLMVGVCAGLFVGCATMGRVHAEKPPEVLFKVRADLGWQNSGVYARTGMVIQCWAEGTWGDNNGMYDGDGNPEVIKDHLGIGAAANSLLLKISNQTNVAYYVGRDANMISPATGDIMFRNNVSLPVGMKGALTVHIMSMEDADGDGMSDYDEVNIWRTNPLSKDTDGDGFDDAMEINDKKTWLAHRSEYWPQVFGTTNPPVRFTR